MYILLIGFCILSLNQLVMETNACEDIEFVTREQWNARDSRENDTMVTPVPHLFIHHTAMRECTDFKTCSRMMQIIQNYHMDSKGWDDIGYNFLIGGDGRVYIGRGWDRVGAHTYGYNKISVAFSLMGNFSNVAPSQLMLNTTKNLIECARTENRVTPDFKLHGHRDAGATECPGSALYDIIKLWPHFQGRPLPKNKS